MQCNKNAFLILRNKRENLTKINNKSYIKLIINLSKVNALVKMDKIVTNKFVKNQ